MRNAHLLCFALFVVACGDGPAVKSKTTSNNVDPNVAANVDPGSAELNVGALSGPVIEGNPPVTLGLSLQRAPQSPVTVTISSPSTEVVVEPAQVTFEASTFAVTQRVSVSAIDNSEVTENRPARLDFTLASDDASFNARPVAPLAFEVIDDDANPSYDVTSDDGFEVAEDGTSVTLDVALSIQPDGDVLVPLRIDDPDEASIDVTQMTFGPLDWNLPQRVTVTGLDDLEPDGDTTFNLVLGPSNSTGATYNGAAELAVSFVNVGGVCGNGVVDGAEQCEPSASEDANCPYGQMSCSYCGDTCQLRSGTVSGYCGDGTVQAANEECDGPTERCVYGEMSCTTCSSGCLETAGRVTGYCGDGVIQTNEGERCDPATSTCCSSACRVEATADCVPECLIISSYLEGSGFNKGVSIYNCGTQSESLTGVKMCIYRNADTSCTDHYAYSGTIAPGEIITICNDQATDPAAVAVCDDFESSVTQFNGDDRLALFVDLNSNDQISSGDVVIDAFGELVGPAFNSWQDKLLHRCFFTPYSGTGGFNWMSYYTQSSTLSMGELDDVPTQGCP